MWTIANNLRRRTRLISCIGAAALVLSAGTAALAQDRGSYRDRGDRYQRATSSSDVRARTRSQNNTRPEYRRSDSRSTVVRSRSTPQYHYVDRDRSYRSSFRDRYNYGGNRYSNSSLRVFNQINIGSGYSYHRPYRPVYKPHYRPTYSYAEYRYEPAYGYQTSYQKSYYRPSWRTRHYGSYYRPYHSGSSISIRFGDHYRPAYQYQRPVILTPRIGFGFYGVYSSDSFGMDYGYQSSYRSYRSSYGPRYGSPYHYGPSYSHRVIGYSDYAPRSSASITVRYNYRD